MVLSAFLKNYSDLALVGALLVVNAVLGFMQEQRAAGVVETLRKRLQVNARVRRDSSWQVIPAPELVPGDIIPADMKLVTGAMSSSDSPKKTLRVGIMHELLVISTVDSGCRDSSAGCATSSAGQPGIWATLAPDQGAKTGTE